MPTTILYLPGHMIQVESIFTVDLYMSFYYVYEFMVFKSKLLV